MTMTLCLAILAVLLAATEVVNFVAPQFLAELHREEAISDALRQAKQDRAEAAKKVASLDSAAKAVRQELSRLKEAAAEVDRESEQRRKVDPVLIFSIDRHGDIAEGHVRRFRAPISKTLPQNAEPYQKQFWRQTCFVEIVAYSANEAIVEAHLQFPSKSGYVTGKFVDMAAAGSNGEAKVAAGLT